MAPECHGEWRRQDHRGSGLIKPGRGRIQAVSYRTGVKLLLLDIVGGGGCILTAWGAAVLDQPLQVTALPPG